MVNMDNTRDQNYASFLLRLWRLPDDGRGTWVVSVQGATTGQQRSFANVEAFIRFLQAEFGSDEATE
jgi:hypothetical protein